PSRRAGCVRWSTATDGRARTWWPHCARSSNTTANGKRPPPPWGCTGTHCATGSSGSNAYSVSTSAPPTSAPNSCCRCSPGRASNDGDDSAPSRLGRDGRAQHLQSLVQKLVGDGQRGQEPEHVAVASGGQHKQTLLVAAGGDPGGELRVRSAVTTGMDEFDRDHRAPAADVAHDVVGALDVAQGREHGLADTLRPGQQVVFLDLVEHAQRGLARDGVPAERAAQPTRGSRVHQLGAPGDGGDGQSPAEPLGGGDDV